MDASRSKDSLRAAGKKRLEEFRLKRQQRVESKNAEAPAAEESGSAARAAIKDENATAAQAAVQNEDVESQILDSRNQDAVSKNLESPDQDVLEHGGSKEEQHDLLEKLRVSNEEKAQAVAQVNDLALKVEELESQRRSALSSSEEKLHALTTQLESCAAERSNLDASLTSSREQVCRKEEDIGRVVVEFKRLISFLHEDTSNLELQSSTVSEDILSSIRSIKKKTNVQELELKNFTRRVEQLEEEKSMMKNLLSSSVEELTGLRTQLAKEREEHVMEVAAKKLENEEHVLMIRSREDEIEKITEDRASLSTRLAEQSQETEELQERDTSQRLEIQTLQEEIDHLKKKLNDAKRREEEVNSELHSVKVQHEHLLEQNASNKVRFSQLDEEIDILRQEKATLSSQLTAFDEETRAGRTEMLTDCQNLKQQLEDARKWQDYNVSDLESLRSQLEQERNSSESLESQKRSIQVEVHALTEENSRISNQLTSLLQDLNFCRLELQSTRTSLMEAQEREEKKNFELESLKSQLQELEKVSNEKLSVASGMVDDLRKHMEAVQDEKHAAVSSYENKNRSLEEQVRTIEDQLANKGSLIEEVLYARLDEALERLRQLENSYLDALDKWEGRSISHYEKYATVLDTLASLLETIAQQVDRDVFQIQTEIDELDKSVRNQTKNVKRLMANVVEDTDKPDTSVEGCVAALISKVKRSDGQLENLHSQHLKLSEELATIKTERHSDLVTADQTIAGQEAEISRLLEREKCLLDEIARENLLKNQLQLQLESVSVSEDAAKSKVEELLTECVGLRQKISDFEETLASVKMEKDAAAQSMVKKEAEILETVRVMQDDLAAANFLREQLEVQLEKAKETAFAAQRDVQIAATVTDERDALKQRLNELEASSSVHKQQVADYENQITSLRTSCDEMKTCLRKIEDLINDACSIPAVGRADTVGIVDVFLGEFIRTKERASGAEREAEKALEKIELVLAEQSNLRQEMENAGKKVELSATERSKLENMLSQERNNVSLMEAKINEYEVQLQGLWTTMSRVLSREMEVEPYSVQKIDRSVNTLVSKFLTIDQTNKNNLLQLQRLEGYNLELQHEISSKAVVMKNLENQVRELTKALTQIKSDTDALVADGNAYQSKLRVASAEKDRLQQELSESEQRLANVREKLGLAIKKGKSVSQQRDDLKQQLTLKLEELEHLNKQLGTFEASKKEKATEVETLRKSLAEKTAAWETEFQAIKAALSLKQKEVDTLKSLLQESSSRENKLASDVNVAKRKYTEILEEKQLLEESKRQAWLELQQASDEVKRLKTGENHLKSSLHAVEERNNRLQQDLSCSKDELAKVLVLQSQKFEKKMAAFTDLELVAASLQQSVSLESEIQAFPTSSSNWDEHANKVRQLLKPSLSETSEVLKEGLEILKGGLEIEFAAFLDKASITKQIIHGSLTGLTFLGKGTSVAAKLQNLEAQEQELSACRAQLSSKDRELESLLRDGRLKNSQINVLSGRVEELETLLEQNHQTMDDIETSRNKVVGKLTFTLGKFKELQQQCEAMLAEIENLQTNLDKSHTEIADLNRTVETFEKDLKERKDSSMQLENSLRLLVTKIKSGQRGEYLLTEPKTLADVLDAHLQRLQHENENLQLVVQTKDAELREIKDKVPTFIPAPSPVSEIEELEQPKYMAVPSTRHFRSQKKTANGDQVTIDVDSQSLEIEEKGNAFKSLGMLRFVPKSSHHISDRVDGLCISAGRVLMRQPVARLSLIVYWIAIHVWIAVTVTMAKI